MVRGKGKYDVILVQPKIVSPYKIHHLPFGPLFLAPHLQKAGFRVMIFDDRFDDRRVLARILRDNEIILAGFTVFTGPVIIDARNVYEPKQMADMGFSYRGIGRGYNSR